MNSSSWRCENLYSDDIPRIYIGQECTTTPYSSTTTLSGTAENPIVVRDDGSLIFGLGIIIFFSAIMFFGLLFNSLGIKK